MKYLRHRLTFANLVSAAALFVALGGTAWAVAANSIGTAQLRNGAVSRPKLANAAVGTAQLGNFSVRAQHFGPLRFQESQATVADKKSAAVTATCPGNSKPIASGAFWKDAKNPNNVIEAGVADAASGLTLSSVRFVADSAGVHSVRVFASNNSGNPEILVAQALCLVSR